MLSNYKWADSTAKMSDHPQAELQLAVYKLVCKMTSSPAHNLFHDFCFKQSAKVSWLSGDLVKLYFQHLLIKFKDPSVSYLTLLLFTRDMTVSSLRQFIDSMFYAKLNFTSIKNDLEMVADTLSKYQTKSIKDPKNNTNHNNNNNNNNNNNIINGDVKSEEKESTSLLENMGNQKSSLLAIAFLQLLIDRYETRHKTLYNTYANITREEKNEFEDIEQWLVILNSLKKAPKISCLGLMIIFNSFGIMNYVTFLSQLGECGDNYDKKKNNGMVSMNTFAIEFKKIEDDIEMYIDLVQQYDLVFYQSFKKENNYSMIKSSKAVSNIHVNYLLNKHRILLLINGYFRIRISNLFESVATDIFAHIIYQFMGNGSIIFNFNDNRNSGVVEDEKIKKQKLKWNYEAPHYASTIVLLNNPLFSINRTPEQEKRRKHKLKQFKQSKSINCDVITLTFKKLLDNCRKQTQRICVCIGLIGLKKPKKMVTGISNDILNISMFDKFWQQVERLEYAQHVDGMIEQQVMMNAFEGLPNDIKSYYFRIDLVVETYGVKMNCIESTRFITCGNETEMTTLDKWDVKKKFSDDGLAQHHICLIMNFENHAIWLNSIDGEMGNVKSKSEMSDIFVIDKDYMYIPFVSSQVCDCNNYGGFGNQIQIGSLSQTEKDAFFAD